MSINYSEQVILGYSPTMKDNSLETNYRTRRVLENVLEENQRRVTELESSSILLKEKLDRVNVTIKEQQKSDILVLSSKDQVALRNAMRAIGTNDTIHWNIAAMIHNYCLNHHGVENVIKIGDKHLLINMSSLYVHFYLFPYKYRIERHLLGDESARDEINEKGELLIINNSHSWFTWIVHMLVNEFKL